jgi:hypothetical protein
MSVSHWESADGTTWTENNSTERMTVLELPQTVLITTEIEARSDRKTVDSLVLFQQRASEEAAVVEHEIRSLDPAKKKRYFPFGKF